MEKLKLCPYVKPNTNTKYLSTMSNHPKSVLSIIPSGVNKRLSNNSSGQREFMMQAKHFQDALAEAGYQDKLKFEKTDVESKRRPRRRNVIWFNPPWSMNVRTNIAGRFLALIRKHFPPGSPLYHLFNTKKVKVSYSTVPNMKQYISSHNSKIIKKAEGQVGRSSYGCNCSEGVNSCPLQGEFLVCYLHKLVEPFTAARFIIPDIYIYIYTVVL